MGDFHRKSLADAILVRAWKHVRDPVVLEPRRATYLHPRTACGELFRGTEYDERDIFLADLQTTLLRDGG